MKQQGSGWNGGNHEFLGSRTRAYLMLYLCHAGESLLDQRHETLVSGDRQRKTENPEADRERDKRGTKGKKLIRQLQNFQSISSKARAGNARLCERASRLLSYADCQVQPLRGWPFWRRIASLIQALSPARTRMEREQPGLLRRWNAQILTQTLLVDIIICATRKIRLFEATR